MRLGRPVLLAALALAAAPPAAPAAQTVHAGPLTGTVDDGVGVRVERSGAGVTAVHLSGPAGARTVSIRFPARRGERLTGFGERSNAVDQRGRDVLNYTADGPFLEADQTLAGAATPDWAEVDSRDATYYPIPWLLSSRGYGVLVDNDETSRFLLRGGSWRVEVDAGRLDLRVFAGPRPADALRRFTRATGRQPAPPAPWAYGPWVQTGQPNVVPLAEESRIFRTLRDADAPVSAAETQMHFLPCGAHRLHRDVRARAHAPPARRGAGSPRLLQPAPVRGLPAGLRRGRRGRSAAARRRRPAVHVLRVRRRRGAQRLQHRAARPVRLHRAGREAALRAPAERGGRAGQGRLDGGLRRVDVARRRASRRDRAGAHPQPLPARLPLRGARHRAPLRPSAGALPALRLDGDGALLRRRLGRRSRRPSGASTACARP